MISRLPHDATRVGFPLIRAASPDPTVHAHAHVRELCVERVVAVLLAYPTCHEDIASSIGTHPRFNAVLAPDEYPARIEPAPKARASWLFDFQTRSVDDVGRSHRKCSVLNARACCRPTLQGLGWSCRRFSPADSGPRGACLRHACPRHACLRDAAACLPCHHRIRYTVRPRVAT